MTNWIRRFSLITMVMMLGLVLAACGGVEDTTIPPPPNGAEVKQGEDANIDMLMSSMDSAMQQSASENNITVDKQTIFKSSDSTSAVVDFYKSEMKTRGWSNEQSQEQSGMTVLTYQSGSQGAIILVMDGSMMMVDGTLVYTLNGTEK